MPDANERKQAERERKKALGLIRVEFWIRPEWLSAIQALIDGLRSQEKGKE